MLTVGCIHRGSVACRLVLFPASLPVVPFSVSLPVGALLSQPAGSCLSASPHGRGCIDGTLRHDAPQPGLGPAGGRPDVGALLSVSTPENSNSN